MSFVIFAALIAAGHPERAIAVLRSQLSEMDASDATFPILVADLVEAHLASGDLGSARATAGWLPGADHGHPQALALTERATGLVAAAQEESDRAANRLRRQPRNLIAWNFPSTRPRPDSKLPGCYGTRIRRSQWSRQVGHLTVCSDWVRIATQPQRPRCCAALVSPPGPDRARSGCFRNESSKCSRY